MLLYFLQRSNISSLLHLIKENILFVENFYGSIFSWRKNVEHVEFYSPHPEEIGKQYLNLYLYKALKM